MSGALDLADGQEHAAMLRQNYSQPRKWLHSAERQGWIRSFPCLKLPIITSQAIMSVQKPENDIVKQITEGLSGIFRHMLPGLAILGVAAVSHPSWFPPWSTLNEGWHIAILGTIALTVGNVWYVAHRYTVHQL